jgi:voltage-gated potassium channel
MKEKNKFENRNYRQRIWEIFEAVDHEDKPKKALDYFDYFIFVLIILNSTAVILETVKSIEVVYRQFFYWFEVFSVIIFSFEYLGRIWACTSQKRFSHPVLGRIRYMVTPMAIVDLLAIMPFYLTFITYDMRVIRTLRVFRLLRMMKLVRYSASISLFSKVLKNRKEELIVTASIVLVMMVLSASFMYFAEHQAQPDEFPDIPSSMWWAIVTLTTVGYGDVFPITTLGKIFAAVIAILGIGMFALPTGILGASFVEELEKQRLEKNDEIKIIICPHCGEEVGEKLEESISA